MAEVSLLVHDLEAAVSPKGSGPLRGRSLAELEVHAPASVAISGDRIAAIGSPKEVLRELSFSLTTRPWTGAGRSRSRTHRLPRSRRFPRGPGKGVRARSRGASYEELHAAGGGILSTVSATRAGSEEELSSAVESTWAGCSITAL